MPGLPGEKGESGHVGLMVSLFLSFIYIKLFLHLKKTINNFYFSHIACLALGSTWATRSRWSSRTYWRTSKSQKYEICVALFIQTLVMHTKNPLWLFLSCAGSNWPNRDDRTIRHCWREGTETNNGAFWTHITSLTVYLFSDFSHSVCFYLRGRMVRQVTLEQLVSQESQWVCLFFGEAHLH